MPNNSAAHSKLVNQTLLEIGKKYPNVRVWKNHTGMAYTPTSVVDAINFILGETMPDDPRKMEIFKLARNKLVPISFGVVGQADISGLINGNGQRLEIEVKTGTGKLADAQKNYRNMIIKMGGKHIELRQVSDLDQINQMELMK
jgi:hypothetical protein